MDTVSTAEALTNLIIAFITWLIWCAIWWRIVWKCGFTGFQFWLWFVLGALVFSGGLALLGLALVPWPVRQKKASR